MTIKPASIMSSQVSPSQVQPAHHHTPTTKLDAVGQGVSTNKTKKKRNRKHKNSEEGDIKSGQNAIASGSKLDSSTEAEQPVKKKLWRRKKKKAEKGDDQTYKPVLIIKKPEDYSANWKLLKEIITKDDKPTTVNKPEVKSKGSYTSQTINGEPGKRQVRKMEEAVQEATHEEEEELDIWFDNVDPILLQTNNQGGKKVPIKKPAHNKKGSKAIESDKLGTLTTSADNGRSEEGLTEVVAMDCEMVGVGIAGKESMLARVSLVNLYGRQIYDKFVRPMEKVEDYRTAVSGVRPYDLEEAEEFTTVQREVSELIQGRKLVGHAIHNDLRVLYLSHPWILIRDTQRYRKFRQLFGGKKPSLKNLTEKVLGVQIQTGEHNSVQDAQAAMRLYTTQRKDWEAMLRESNKRRKMPKVKKQKGVGKMASKNKSKKSAGSVETPSEIME